MLNAILPSSIKSRCFAAWIRLLSSRLMAKQRRRNLHSSACNLSIVKGESFAFDLGPTFSTASWARSPSSWQSKGGCRSESGRKIGCNARLSNRKFARNELNIFPHNATTPDSESPRLSASWDRTSHGMFVQRA